MAANVNWYGDQLLAQLTLASQQMVDEAALLIEGQTKVEITNNGQVDTGFMLNSVYAVTRKGSSYAPGSHPARNDQGAAPAQQPAENGAVVGVAAEYALWQELEASFLMTAVEIVANSMPAKIVEAGKGAL